MLVKETEYIGLELYIHDINGFYSQTSPLTFNLTGKVTLTPTHTHLQRRPIRGEESPCGRRMLGNAV